MNLATHGTESSGTDDDLSETAIFPFMQSEVNKAIIFTPELTHNEKIESRASKLHDICSAQSKRALRTKVDPSW